MGYLPLLGLHVLADVAQPESTAANVMHSFVAPVMSTLCAFASLACIFFLMNGGYHYMSSTGKPEKLAYAKKIIRNALIGLIIVLSAAALTALLTHAYGNAGGTGFSKVPNLAAIQPQSASSGLAGVLIKAVTGFLQNIIETIASPFMTALNYFTTSTPLMAENVSVFKLWLVIVAIADSLFVLVVAMLGFHVMSYATFGLDEIEFKHLLPQIGIVFILVNSSIFAVDGIISLSNAMIHALNSVFPSTSVWSTLSAVAQQSGGISIAALLIMIVFLILAVILLIYYVGRLVTLYIGAVLSPLMFLLWLIPSFRDFVETAAKVYLSTIFVLFIHVVILQLAASIFAGLIATSSTHTPDPIMAMVVGLATVIALLKTQGVLMQLSYASIGPRSARMLGSQLVNSVSFISGKKKSSRAESYSASKTPMYANLNNVTMPKNGTSQSFSRKPYDVNARPVQIRASALKVDSTDNKRDVHTS